jgi:hypothetical protein
MNGGDKSSGSAFENFDRKCCRAKLAKSRFY